MEPGDIVEFFEDKRIFVGVVLELKGERLHVLTQNSREMTLTPKWVLHWAPACPPAPCPARSCCAIWKPLPINVRL